MIQGRPGDAEARPWGRRSIAVADDCGKRRTLSDLTNEEGTRIAPPILPAKQGGNKRTAIMREGVDALIDVRAGGPRRAIHKAIAIALRINR